MPKHISLIDPPQHKFASHRGRDLLRLFSFLILLAAGMTVQAAKREPYAFGVLNHRSLQLTAAYWNPILTYVSMRSGIPLELHIGRTADETTDKAIAGQLDFAYTNHLFTPVRARLGWRVLARQDSAGIRGQLVVLDSSRITRLNELQGRTVAFANPYAFVGYYVPMDALLRAGVNVSPKFSGNQEAAMGQLLSGEVAAAAVNSQVMADFAQRKKIKYRVLAESGTYFDLAIMASPRVSVADGERVRQSLVAMAHEPEGQRILREGAQHLDQVEVRGFVRADQKDYINYQQFFKTTPVMLNE